MSRIFHVLFGLALCPSAVSAIDSAPLPWGVWQCDSHDFAFEAKPRVYGRGSHNYVPWLYEPSFPEVVEPHAYLSFGPEARDSKLEGAISIRRSEKPITTYNDPAFQQWEKTVAALSADKQIEAVAKKLQELNPGFDGKFTRVDWTMMRDMKGVVTEVDLCTDNVTDISPIRVFSGLQSLTCGGSSPDKGKLSDLSPLQWTKLETLSILNCSNTQVSDLSPLQWTRLNQFNCSHTNVYNLSPLGGMPLTHLDCSHTQVSDLSFVKWPFNGWNRRFQNEAAFEVLDCSHTNVSNLSPLHSCWGQAYVNVKSTGVTATEITSLQTAHPIWIIDWDGRNKPYATIADPAFLQWAKGVATLPADKQLDAVAEKLFELNSEFDGKLSGRNGADTPRIENDVVTELCLFTDNVTDISPVRALTGLKVLECTGSSSVRGNLCDLSPLHGMPLTYLACDNTKVTSAGVARLQAALPDCQITSDGYSTKAKTSLPFRAGANQKDGVVQATWQEAPKTEKSPEPAKVSKPKSTVYRAQIQTRLTRRQRRLGQWQN